MAHRRLSVLPIALGLCCSTALAAAASPPPTVAATKPTIYQVAWQGQNVVGAIAVNGFEIARFDGAEVAGGAPLNVWLIGDNELTVAARKRGSSAPARLAVHLSAQPIGQVADTSAPGQLLEIALTEAELRGPGPARVGKKFKSALEFKAHLVAARPSAFDERAVLDFATRLHGLFARKEAKPIVRLMGIKAQDYARAFEQPVAGMVEALESQLQNEHFAGTLARIDPKKLRANRVNGLWHVTEGDAELIRSRSGDGATAELAIWIGDVDGALQVVR